MIKTSPRREQSVSAVLKGWWAPVVLVLMAFVSVGIHVPQNQAISPIDEYVYADYMMQLPERLVVARGDLTGPDAREDLICLGNRGVVAPPGPTCEEAATAPSSEFVMGGKTSADIYTPIYFVTTWALAQPLVAAGMGILDAASYVGALWLGLALVLLWRVFRAAAVPDAVTVGLGALLVASPSAFWSSTYISTDAPSLAVGAALTLLVLRICRGRSGMPLFVVISVVGVLLKVQNIAAVALGALALLLWAVGAARAGDGPGGRGHRVSRALVSRPVVTAVLSVVASVLAQGGWLAIRSAIAVGESADQGTAMPLTLKGLATESVKFLGGSGLDPTGGINGTIIGVAGVLVSWVSVAGVIGLVATSTRGSIEKSLSWAALVTSVVIGPVLVLGVSVVTHYYFALPTRYGMSMLPAFLACAGVLFARSRAFGVGVAIAGTLLWAASLTSS